MPTPALALHSALEVRNRDTVRNDPMLREETIPPPKSRTGGSPLRVWEMPVPTAKEGSLEEEAESLQPAAGLDLHSPPSS